MLSAIKMRITRKAFTAVTHIVIPIWKWPNATKYTTIRLRKTSIKQSKLKSLLLKHTKKRSKFLMNSSKFATG